MLIVLARDPALVQIDPFELHDWRGFFRLLVPPHTADVLTFVASGATIGLAVMTWRRTRDWRLRWSVLTLTAVLTSPHLLTYDLLLTALPLLLVADVLAEDGAPPPTSTWIGLLTLYGASILSPLAALTTHVQVSTLAMAWLLWSCTDSCAARAEPRSPDQCT